MLMEREAGSVPAILNDASAGGGEPGGGGLAGGGGPAGCGKAFYLDGILVPGKRMDSGQVQPAQSHSNLTFKIFLAQALLGRASAG